MGHRLALIVALAGTLPGCTVVQAGSGGVSRTLVGVVRIEMPATAGRLAALDVKTLGGGWDGGPFLGWRSANWVVADPRDCQLAVIIRSGTAAEYAAKVLAQLKGANICVADFTHTLRPAQPPSR